MVEGLAGIVLANGTPAIDWYVVGCGGGVRDQPTPCTLGGIYGHTVVGTGAEPGFEVCFGFWFGAAVDFKFHLPLVFRNY